MSTIKIELDLDWIEEVYLDEVDSDEDLGLNPGLTLDEATKSTVVSHIANQIASKQKVEMAAEAAGMVASDLKSVSPTIVMDKMIDAFSKPAGYTVNSWASTSNMKGADLLPLPEFKPDLPLVDQFIDSAIEGGFRKKVLTRDGNKAEYARQAEHSIFEYYIKERVTERVDARMAAMMADVMRQTEEAIASSIKKNFADVMTNFLIENQGSISLSGIGEGLIEKG